MEGPSALKNNPWQEPFHKQEKYRSDREVTTLRKGFGKILDNEWVPKGDTVMCMMSLHGHYCKL